MLCDCLITIIFTRKCSNCDALQPEPSDAAPVLIRFNYDGHAKFEVTQPIHCSVYCRYVSYIVTFDPMT